MFQMINVSMGHLLNMGSFGKNHIDVVLSGLNGENTERALLMCILADGYFVATACYFMGLKPVADLAGP